MKVKFIALIIILLAQSSCFRSSIKTANDIDFKTNHASIQKGMTMDEVKNLLGEPMNRQFMDDQEAWQYCEANLSSREYYAVLFVENVVNGINTYSYGTNSHKGCLHCEECFKEIRFRSIRRSSQQKETIENKLVSAEELKTDFEENGTIVIGNFRSGSAEIDDLINEEFVMELIQKINVSEERYAIVGHTNSQGALESNQKLSESRAKMVSQFLISKYGLLPGKLEVLGKGELEPIDSNETREGRSKNSRVEIRLLTN